MRFSNREFICSDRQRKKRKRCFKWFNDENRDKLPSFALLQDIKAGPNPELAGLYNKRFVVLSEPEKGKKIACSAMKNITGDRILPVRTLYSKKCETILLLTYIVECNE